MALTVSRKARIITLLVIDTVFFFVELTIGYAVHSLALVADSFHMLNDIVSLVIALWAVSIANKPAKEAKYTYGWQRAEIVGALVNGVFLIALCLTIFLEALQRFVEVPSISNPQLILVVGCLGLLSNIVGLFLFHDHSHGHGGGEGAAEEGHAHSHGHNAPGLPHEHDEADGIGSSDEEAALDESDVEVVLPVNVVRQESRRRQSVRLGERQPLLSHGITHDGHVHAQPRNGKNGGGSGHSHGNLNMRGVFLHVMGDALGNIGVICTALVIWLAHGSWRFYFDPAISIVITFIILASAVPLCKSAALILLQVAPHSIEVDDVRKDILALPGVVNVHELHVWQLSDVKMIATVHVLVDLQQDVTENYMNLTAGIRDCLVAYGVHSCTIQPEFTGILPIDDNGHCVLRRVQNGSASASVAQSGTEGGSAADAADAASCALSCAPHNK